MKKFSNFFKLQKFGSNEFVNCSHNTASFSSYEFTSHLYEGYFQIRIREMSFVSDFQNFHKISLAIPDKILKEKLSLLLLPPKYRKFKKNYCIYELFEEKL